MSESQTLLIVTMMPPVGETGVQTHFNAIIREALLRGIQVKLISPYAKSVEYARRTLGLFAKLVRLFDRESSILWYRRIHYILIWCQVKYFLVRNKNCTAVYAQDLASTKAAIASRGRKNQVPIVTVVHFNISEAEEMQRKGLTKEDGRLYRHMRAIERDALYEADKLIFVSTFMRKTITARACKPLPPSQVTIPYFISIPNLLDGGFRVSSDIIAVGTLEPRKNQSFLLKVLAAAHARGRRYRLSIIGAGPDLQMLYGLASELNIVEAVNFLGYQSNAIALMAGHRICAHGAVMDNLPITIIEALSQGLPVLAPAVGGIPEIFDHGQEGFFWPLDDPEVGADMLCALLEDDSLYSAFSARARMRFEERFSADVMAETWFNEILKVNRRQ
jgi:glycosyltransferase involved in cell wall biosynthesis